MDTATVASTEPALAEPPELLPAAPACAQVRVAVPEPVRTTKVPSKLASVTPEIVTKPEPLPPGMVTGAARVTVTVPAAREIAVMDWTMGQAMGCCVVSKMVAALPFWFTTRARPWSSSTPTATGAVPTQLNCA